MIQLHFLHFPPPPLLFLIMSTADAEKDEILNKVKKGFPMPRLDLSPAINFFIFFEFFFLFLLNFLFFFFFFFFFVTSRDPYFFKFFQNFLHFFPFLLQDLIMTCSPLFFSQDEDLDFDFGAKKKKKKKGAAEESASKTEEQPAVASQPQAGASESNDVVRAPTLFIPPPRALHGCAPPPSTLLSFFGCDFSFNLRHGWMGNLLWSDPFCLCGGLGGGLPPQMSVQMSVQMTSRDGGRSWAFVLHVVLAVVLSSLSLSPSLS